MAAVGLSFSDAVEYFRHGVHLLQTVGNDMVDIFTLGVKGWNAAAAGKWMDLLAVIAEAKGDALKIAAAVRAEFGF